MDMIYLITAVIMGSAISLVGGALIFTTKQRRDKAVLVAMPFGAGALLAAAFIDLLPEAFELGEPRSLLLWTLAGFIFFFLLERSASWFHHHHEHHGAHAKNTRQRRLIILGDLMHNAIDGVAIGAAFLVSPATGIITTLAVSAHEIPKELGTFALLLSRGWKDRVVLLANVATAVATLVTAVVVYILGSDSGLPVGPLLASTAGFFVYIAASDIIPDIHEQPRRIGTIQAGTLVAGVVIVGSIIMLLGV
ncbi:MAG: ZIP family metal transporter [Candidatus Saccharimonadales bacterium]